MSRQTTKWIKIVVYKLLKDKNLLHLDLENLIAAGNLGYSQALQKFNKSYGASLKTYAEYRIKGAVLDEVRKMIGDERVKTKKPIQVIDFEPVEMNYTIENLESNISIIQMIDNLNLDENEMKVLKMKIEGYMISDIAQELNISPARTSQLIALVKKVLYNNFDGKLKFSLVFLRCPSCNGAHDISERVKNFRCDYCEVPIKVINKQCYLDNEMDLEGEA